MPLKLRDNVAKAYFDPPHEEFKPRSFWSLQNAFTEAIKQISQNDMDSRMEYTQKVGRLFGLLGEKSAA
jgi:hypothetical protein